MPGGLEPDGANSDPTGSTDGLQRPEDGRSDASECGLACLAASRDLRERFDGGREVSLGPPDEFCLFGGVLFGQLSCYPTSVELKSKRNNDRKHA